MTLSFNKNLLSIITVMIALSCTLFIGIFSIDSKNIRLLIFISLFVFLIALTLKNREGVVNLLIIYLAIMGFLRRALIPVAGWSSFDPLLILGPVITIFLTLMLFWEEKNNQLKNDKPSLLFVTMFIYCALQVFNPFSGSILTGMTASIYILIPWLWYFLAFYKIRRTDINKIFFTIEVLGFFIAVYGLYQSFHGLLPFEEQWVEISGYAALYLAEGTVRSFGTFPSAQEFVYFCVISFMISFTYTISNSNFRFLHLMVAVVTFSAIIFASSRTVIFFIVLAIWMVLFVKRKTILGKIVSSIISFGLVGLIWLLLPKVNPSWFGTAAPAIEHMISGLIDPLSEEDTGVGHINRFVDGILSVFSNPIGHGIGSITNAASKINASSGMTTEVDISNMFVGVGIGGILYFIIIVSTLINIIKITNRDNTIEIQCILGILIACLGQWINGGFYLTSLLIWLFVGWSHMNYIKIYKKVGEIN